MARRGKLSLRRKILNFKSNVESTIFNFFSSSCCCCFCCCCQANNNFFFIHDIIWILFSHRSFSDSFVLYVSSFSVFSPSLSCRLFIDYYICLSRLCFSTFPYVGTLFDHFDPDCVISLKLLFLLTTTFFTCFQSLSILLFFLQTLQSPNCVVVDCWSQCKQVAAILFCLQFYLRDFLPSFNFLFPLLLSTSRGQKRIKSLCN